MWKLPRKIILTSGIGKGNTPLTSFDAALLDAGVGDLNLIKVTSVVPPKAKITKIGDITDLQITNGTLIPTVYTYITSNNFNEKIAAGLITGVPQNENNSGLIFERSKAGSFTDVRDDCMKMLTEAFESRSISRFSVIFEGKEVVVTEKSGKYYTIVALALMLP